MKSFQNKSITFGAFLLGVVFLVDTFLLSQEQQIDLLNYMGRVPDYWWQATSLLLLIPSWFFWKRFFM